MANIAKQIRYKFNNQVVGSSSGKDIVGAPNDHGSYNGDEAESEKVLWAESPEETLT